MRFANQNTKDTLKIYSVSVKSLGAFRSKNRQGQDILPHDNCRLIKEEIQGSDDVAESLHKAKLVTPSKGDTDTDFDGLLNESTAFDPT